MSVTPRDPKGRPPGPVRFKIAYKSPESLLENFTKSIGQGMVALESRARVPVGTRFIFELLATGVAQPVEVMGEVQQVTPSGEGKFLLTVRYDAGGNRSGIDAILQTILDAHQDEQIRQHPRIPLHLRATEEIPNSPSYLLRDISRGGMRLEVELPHLPPRLQVGAPVRLELWLSLGALALRGEVAWVFAPPNDGTGWTNPAFGVTFGELSPDTAARLEKILSLRELPPPPWRARISFGANS